MAKHFACFVGVLLALCWAVTGDAQSNQFSLELGYQWVDVSGNNGVFRTQANEKQGLQLRSFSLTSLDSSTGSKAFDRLRIDAGGLGASTQGYLRLDAGL
ncbi:MAG TPA: hypothetical protein VI700_05755, partial [Thermoanaerobaculaceae bacterium]|nr:hypothetical protein [Thermoanaerobaculaceae bacterium]